MAHSSALTQPLRQFDFLRLLEKHGLFIWLVFLYSALSFFVLACIRWLLSLQRNEVAELINRLLLIVGS